LTASLRRLRSCRCASDRWGHRYRTALPSSWRRA